VVLETAVNMSITAVLYILMLVVLETAVNMSTTAVLYIPVVGGSENRGEYVHNRGIRYID
jgi:hypothetical protein